MLSFGFLFNVVSFQAGLLKAKQTSATLARAVSWLCFVPGWSYKPKKKSGVGQHLAMCCHSQMEAFQLVFLFHEKIVL